MTTELLSPACATGCEPCTRECAVARIMADWWHREYQRLLTLPSPDPEDLEEAHGHLRDLRKRIVPGSHPAAPKVQLSLVH